MSILEARIDQNSSLLEPQAGPSGVNNSLQSTVFNVTSGDDNIDQNSDDEHDNSQGNMSVSNPEDNGVGLPHTSTPKTTRPLKWKRRIKLVCKVKVKKQHKHKEKKYK